MSGRRRIALALAVLAAIAVAWPLGALDWVTHDNIHRLLAESGAWGPVLYVAAFTAFEPFGVPGAVFVLPASLAWETSFAVAMSVLGATGAGITSFALARGVLGDKFEQRLPPRLRAMTATAREHPLRTVILVRVLFGLAAPAHWALALSGVRLTPFVLGSLIGFVPPMLAFVVFGRAIIEWLERQRDVRLWPLAIVAAVLGYFAYRWWFRRTPRKLRESADEPR
jgi:uncharacterized membrane protein YdjX (TVP38/TMEM64 family)